LPLFKSNISIFVKLLLEH